MRWSSRIRMKTNSGRYAIGSVVKSFLKKKKINAPLPSVLDYGRLWSDVGKGVCVLKASLLAVHCCMVCGLRSCTKRPIFCIEGTKNQPTDLDSSKACHCVLIGLLLMTRISQGFFLFRNTSQDQGS